MSTIVVDSIAAFVPQAEIGRHSLSGIRGVSTNSNLLVMWFIHHLLLVAIPCRELGGCQPQFAYPNSIERKGRHSLSGIRGVSTEYIFDRKKLKDEYSKCRHSLSGIRGVSTREENRRPKKTKRRRKSPFPVGN